MANDGIIDIEVDESPVTPATGTPQTTAAAAVPEFDGGGETTFGDETVTRYKFDMYKGRTNVADRIAILNPNHLRWHRTHYVEKKGHTVCLTKFTRGAGGREVIDGEPSLCCKRLPEPRKRFAGLVVQYATDPSGKLLKPLSYQLKLWRFSEDKFVQLRDINNEFPLDKHDIIVRCTEEGFQKMTMQPCKDSLIRHEKFPADQKAEIENWWKTNLVEAQKSLGSKRSEAEILTLLGMATGARTVAQEHVVGDIGDLLPTE